MTRALLRSESSPEEARRAVRRLLAATPEAPETMPDSTVEPRGGVPLPRLPEPPANAYDGVFARVHERVKQEGRTLGRERSAAARLWAEIEPRREGRRLRVRNDRRFHTWGFCERLLDAAAAVAAVAPGRERDPQQTLEIAELALEAVHHLDAGRYGEERVADLQALAWSAVGDARRLGGELEEARGAFDCAAELLTRGTGDPLARAALAGHRATLAVDLQEYAEAAEHLERAIRLHRLLGDDDYAGERLVQEALRRAGEKVDEPAHRRRSG